MPSRECDVLLSLGQTFEFGIELIPFFRLVFPTVALFSGCFELGGKLFVFPLPFFRVELACREARLDSGGALLLDGSSVLRVEDLLTTGQTKETEDARGHAVGLVAAGLVAAGRTKTYHTAVSSSVQYTSACATPVANGCRIES